MTLQVLLVDDDRTLRSMTAFVLEMAGYAVTTASSGLEAISKLKVAAFDAIVTDLVMPEMDGLELIRKIRAGDGAIQIVAISGGSSNLTVNYLPHAKVFGANAVLHKPIDPQQLTKVLAELLSGSAELAKPLLVR